MEKEKFKHKPGKGSLFYNEKSNDKQPDVKGTIVLPNGEEYRISGWKKEGGKGEYYSLAIDTYNNNGSGGEGLPF